MNVELKLSRRAHGLVNVLLAGGYKGWSEKDLIQVIIATELERGLLRRARWELKEFERLEQEQPGTVDVEIDDVRKLVYGN